MREEDLLLVNPGRNYQILSAEKALCGKALYSIQFLSRVLENRNLYFYCNSMEDRHYGYQDLKDILYTLTTEYATQKRQSNCLIYSTLLKLLDRIIENYQIDKEYLYAGGEEADSRMWEMMQYIAMNITGELSLSDLAERMYISTSTLSRTFKKSTGEYFADYVTRLRVQLSLARLAHTGQNMTEIAMSCGFSNSSSFNRAFKKVMKITPTEYREHYRKNSTDRMESEKKPEELLKQELIHKGYTGERKSQKPVGLMHKRFRKIRSKRYGVRQSILALFMI